MAINQYGSATLTNVAFGVSGVDNGIAQSADINFTVEDEEIRGTEGERLGGVKHGQQEELSVEYISNSTPDDNFDLLAGDSQLSYLGRDWEVVSMQRSASNTGFLTISIDAKYSTDWS